MKTFGQEFHPHDAIRALRIAEKIKTRSRRELTTRIAGELPHDSASTRKRIAGKFIQRYVHSSRSKIAPWSTQAFAHLVAKTRHAPGQIELLYFELTKTDEIVGALARELFYPVCIEGKAPREYSEDEFAARNGNRFMFGNERIVTREFIAYHARTRWNFCSVPSLDRALRVLLGAGFIARERMTELRDHPVSFRLAEHDVSPVTFAWACYDEYLPRLESGDFLISRGDFCQARFAQTLLLETAQVEQGIEALRRHQLLSATSDGLRLVFPNRSTLVAALLSKAI